MKLHYRSNLSAGCAALIAAVLLSIITPVQVASETSTVHGISSRTLPYALSILTGVCGLGLIFQSIVLKKDEVKELELKKELKGLFYMLVLLAYGLGLKHSFLISTSLLGVATLAFTKCKKPWYYAITIITVVVIYFIFTQLLHVRLP